MGIIKADDIKREYVIIPNSTIYNKNLELESLAVLVFLAAHPPAWEIRDHYVKSRFNFGRDKLRKIWKNLEENGYCVRKHKVRGKGGTFQTETTIYVEQIKSYTSP